MRVTGMAVMMVVAAASGRAGVAPAASRQLTICMETDGGNAAGQRENEARRVASNIFAAIGVKMRWLEARKCPSEAIYISFSRTIPAGVHSSALAYALPYEGTHIVVFLDRVKQSAAPSASGSLLGYTLAHEITHILEGVARHSNSGIMKAYWGLADHDQMRQGRLGFAPEDVSLIYRGVDERESRLAGLASGAQMQ